MPSPCGAKCYCASASFVSGRLLVGMAAKTQKHNKKAQLRIRLLPLMKVNDVKNWPDLLSGKKWHFVLPIKLMCWEGQNLRLPGQINLLSTFTFGIIYHKYGCKEKN